MNVEILIVSHSRDFPYLQHCLRSISKFTSGFRGVTLVVPDADVQALWPYVRDSGCESLLSVRSGAQWPEQGMLWHMNVIMHSEQWVDKPVDFVAHVDSDCIFDRPTTPEDYFAGSKPILLFKPFVQLLPVGDAYRVWKQNVMDCLGIDEAREFMQRHPAVHYMSTYPMTRNAIERHVGLPFPDWLRTRRTVYPQTFGEFQALGSFAWQHLQQQYHWINLEHEPKPQDHLIQFWGRKPLDEPQDTWVHGEFVRGIVPLQKIREVMGNA